MSATRILKPRQKSGVDPTDPVKNPLGVNARGGVLTSQFTREVITRPLDCWFGNKLIPLDDARRYIIASELFNSYLRGADEFYKRDY